jgi:hypothetical protein
VRSYARDCPLADYRTDSVSHNGCLSAKPIIFKTRKEERTGKKRNISISNNRAGQGGDNNYPHDDPRKAHRPYGYSGKYRKDTRQNEELNNKAGLRAASKRYDTEGAKKARKRR